MGWVLLPPFFAVLTATACDLANAVKKARLPYSRITETHRLEAVADTLPSAADSGLAPPECGLRYGTLPILGVSNADVFVDDFLLLARTQEQQCMVLLRSTLADQVAIDKVFVRPLEVGDPSHCKEPAFVKKMQKR